VGQPFKVSLSVRAPAFGFFHQQPAQRIHQLVYRKKRVPKLLRPWPRHPEFGGNSLAETRRETQPGHPALSSFPLGKACQPRREERDVIPADAMVEETQLW
jgi:hypothetical protein